ncbi:hypothetical protein HK104_009430 [Borealophlyctis nickersoniae]|nr:hypothetical protein HK104_009430 [Borealophlyctis nickersoniae]
MSVPRPWTLRKVKECGPNYDPTFRTVTPLPIDLANPVPRRPVTAVPVIRPGTSIGDRRKSMQYPSHLKKVERTEALEKQLEDQMILEFQGLSEAQRNYLLHTVMKPLDSCPVPSHPSLSASSHSNDSNESPHSLVQSDSFNSEASFPLDEYQLKSKPDKDSSTTMKKTDKAGHAWWSSRSMSYSSDAPTVKPAVKSAVSPAQKYGKLIEPRRGRAKPMVGEIDESHAEMEMRKVVTSLRRWVTTTLDSPAVLLPALPPSTSADPLPPPPPPMPLDDDDSPGDFAMLLNPWSTQIDADRAPRVRVTLEDNPPEELLKTIRKGREVEWGGGRIGVDGTNITGPRRPQTAPASDNRAEALRELQRRFHYGAWYINPREWNTVLQKTTTEAEDKVYFNYVSVIQKPPQLPL